LQTNNNNIYNNYFSENPQVIGGPANDSTNQYYQNNTQYLNNYETSQNTFQSFQSYNNNTNQYVESSAYSGQVDNGQNNMTEEEIKKILQQNENVNKDGNMEQTETNANVDFSDLKDFEGTKILPIKTTSRILPVLGPFTDTDLKGLDIYNMVNQNIQKNNDIPFQPIENVQATQATPPKNAQSGVKKKIVKKGLSKKAPSQGKLKTESEEIKKLRAQVAELEQLKKKMAKMEVLEGQLTELNTLRAQVAEYNSVKSQLKEIFNLKAQNKQLKEQLSKLDELRAKAEEAENLKLRVQELEEINHKYEEEIKFLKENERMYSMRSRVSNSENKEMGYEDNQPEPEEEMTVQGDIIQDTEELELITKKINKLNQKLTVNLLYKASADSDKAEAFHAKCDQAKSTIVLVETDKGKRFGGYTTCDWSGDCIEKKDEEAFVFSLDKLKTYDNIPGEDAIGCYPKFGPIFLGCQIRIYDDAFSKGGTTFEKGLNFDTQEDFELTGGDRVFNVKEIEVYEVIKE
jgi:DNA repair exonuclease SbcCD ATPase subunit